MDLSSPSNQSFRDGEDMSHFFHSIPISPSASSETVIGFDSGASHDFSVVSQSSVMLRAILTSRISIA